MNKKSFLEIMPSKADLKNWLANGKIKETIDVLLNIAKESEDNDLENSIVQQANRFNKLLSEELNGILPSEEIQVRTTEAT